MHNDKFTQAKPFQPRTLKSTRTSKLSQFKDYTPPVKKSTDDDGGGPTMRPDTGMSGKGLLVQCFLFLVVFIKKYTKVCSNTSN